MKLKTIIFYQKIPAILLFVLACNFIFSQTLVTYSAGPTNSQINTALQGSNVAISGGTLNLGNRTKQIATFTGGTAAGLSMANGVYFGTGDVAFELGHTNDSSASTNSPGIDSGDTDLSTIDATCTFDVASYSFTVTMGPKATILNIGYQFGSEEYPDFVGSPFDDAFGFFVSGPGITGTQNLAKLPNGNPTSINKVNVGTPGHYPSAIPPTVAAYDGSQSALYINNGHKTNLDANGFIVEYGSTPNGPIPSGSPAPVVAVQFNGLTKLITYNISGLTSGGTYTFKIAIGDNTDNTFDSGVFIDQIYGTATVVATNDTETISAGATGTVNVLTNDSYNSTSPVTLTDVTLSQVSTTNTGVNINTTTGLVTVAAGTAPGVYNIVYQICDNTFSSNCKTATMAVTVLANSDTDGDGIVDTLDLDDDNDGILDTEEQIAIAPDFSALTIGAANGSTFVSGQTLISNVACTTNYTTSMSGTFNYTTLTTPRPLLAPRGDNQGNIGLGVQGNQTSAYEEVVLNFTNPVYVKIYNSNVTGGAANPGPYGNFDDADEWTLIANTGGFTVFDGTAFQTSLTVNSGNQIKFQNGTVTNNATFDVRTNELVTSLTLRFKSHNASVAANYSPIRVALLMPLDSDCDGIINDLDLDSDNDGCPDAIEGGANITLSQLVSSAGTLQGGNGVNPVTPPTSGTYNQAVLQNLCATTYTATPATDCVGSTGIPTLVNQTIGQTSGTAYSSTIGNNACKCYKPAATGGTILPTNHGISTLGRAGDDGDGNTTNDWPMVRKGAWTVLESKTKGFVINRVTLTADLANITPAVEGMMVYDEEADCLKIYTKDDAPATTSSWRCFNNQTCPDVL